MKNIAIIGSGISGMAAAYLLQRAGYAVTIYERAQRVGGHTRTLTVDYNGVPMAVDTGFIVFNYANYPHLAGLFAHLGVEVQKSDMTLAITVDNGRFEWGAQNLNAVFGQRRNLLRPAFYRMIKDVHCFNTRSLDVIEQTPDITLAELLAALGTGDDFMRYYLLPMGGAIWSCPPSVMLSFPARQFVQFFKNHGLLSFTGQHQWYTVTGGSQRYVEKLTASFRERIRTGCAAVRVLRYENEVKIADSHGGVESYDHVIFACHADEALAMLGDATADELSILGAFHYQENIAYLHKDSSFMPRRKHCWSSWVYHADTSQAQPGAETKIGVTYWMNKLQSLNMSNPIFVTLNPSREIAPENVFDKHTFTHPVFDNDTLAAQGNLHLLQGKKNSWFCGAYTRHGFHEDGLLSAVQVAESMGVNIPW